MNCYKIVAVIVLAGAVLLPGISSAQTVFLARKALGAVSHLVSKVQESETAAVLLEVSADKVYNAALKTLSENPAVRITSKDDRNRTVDFNYHRSAVAMKVSAINDTISQLIVSASGKDSKDDSSFVLNGVFRICKEAGVQCRMAD